MSPQVNVTDGFYAEQTWRQLQWERHQRFLAQLKAEFRAARQQQPLSHSITPSVPTSTASAVTPQRRDRTNGRPLQPRAPITAKP